MKITTIQLLLLISCVISVYAKNLKAQEILEKKITVNVQNQELRKVIVMIEKQTNVKFVYSPSAINVTEKITYHSKSSTINSFLSEVLVPINIQFNVIDNQILLSPVMQKSMTAINLEISSMGKTITGKVTSEDGTPLAGASVRIKGTSKGTTTDSKGVFKISVLENEKTLLISFTGYKEIEVSISFDKSNYDVRLTTVSSKLEDVIVVGYGTQKKSEVTGSIATVSGEEINKTPSASTSNTLGGRIPGLISQQGTGEPGQDQASISIRGFGQALTIVDGVEQDFNGINPAEIESISVLKDASAAIYGARSGNGVILITTKKGKLGRPKITFNSTYTSQSYIQLPKMVSSGQYAEEMRDVDVNTGVNPSQVSFTQDQINKYYAGTNPDYPNTDWWKAAMNNSSPMYKVDMSVSGGTENVKYAAFIGYLQQYGFAKSNNNIYNKYNMRVNLEANISKNLSAEFSVSGILSDQNRSNADIGDYGSFWNDYYWSLPIAKASFPNNSYAPYGGSATAGNPVIDTRSDISGSQKTNIQNLRGSVALNYKIPGVKGLTARGFFDYQGYRTDLNRFNKFYQTYTYTDSTQMYKQALSSGPTTLTVYDGYSTTLTRQLSLNYSNTFNQKHQVSALVLYEGIDYATNSFWASRQGFLSSNLPYLFAGSPAAQTNSGSATEASRASVVGRFNYGYDQKYFIQGTLRYDGSPNFPPSTRWGLFPSISAAWLITHEKFMEKSPVSTLKLRLSYSNTGYDNVGAFQYLSAYNLGQVQWSVNGSSQVGISSTGLANPNITWEQMKNYDGGFDFGFLNNSLYGTVDLFYRLRSGILGTRAVSLPVTFGAVLPDENINSYADRGFELSVGYKKSYGKFAFDVNANVTYTRAKWKHYDEPKYTTPDDIRVLQVSGKWTDLMWGYKTAGLFASQADINSVTYNLDGHNNATVKPGDIKYVDIGNHGVIDYRDQIIVGTQGLPKYMFGLNFSLKYGQFDMNGLIQGSAGRDISVVQNIDSKRGTSAFLFENMYTPQKNNLNALYPLQDLSTYNTSGSDYWTKNASYLRFKDLSVGYNFTHLFNVKSGVSNLRIYLAATNFLTISGLKKYGVDPEYLQQNYSKVPGAIYPKLKTFSVGANLIF